MVRYKRNTCKILSICEKMIIKKLDKLGITIDSLLDAGMALYIGDDEEKDKVREKLKIILLMLYE